jgi:iron(III) transport system permease protein
VLWTVTLPLLRPILAGAGTIAFVLSVTSFGVPVVLGIPAGFTTMTTRIYRDFAFSSDPESFVRAIGLAILLALGATLLIALSDVSLGRLRMERSGVFGGPRIHRSGRPGGPGSSRRGTRAVAFVLAWAILVVTLVLPMAALAVTALAKAPGLAPVPANWSLDNVLAVVDEHTLKALVNSVSLAGASALLVIGLGAALVAARRRRGARPVSALLGITFALPGSTLAVAVLLAYGPSLRDTLLIILVAYLAKFWALGYRPVSAGLEGMSADLPRAARISGADGWTTTRTIMLPILRPMVLAGGLVVFLFGLHEVTMSSLLVGPGTATLGVVVLDFQQLGNAGLSAALALLLTGLVALVGAPVLRHGGALERLGW